MSTPTPTSSATLSSHVCSMFSDVETALLQTRAWCALEQVSSASSLTPLLSSMTALSQLHAQLITDMRSEQQHIIKLNELTRALTEQNAQLQANISLAQQAAPSPSPSPAKATAPAQTHMPLSSIPANNNAQNVNNKQSSVAAPTPKKTKQVIIPSITKFNEEEFEKIPKYMRGRLSVDKLNDVVQAFNDALSYKYTLLSRPIKSLTQGELANVQAWDDAESDDSVGTHHVSLDDLRINVMVSSLGHSLLKSVVMALRSGGRIRTGDAGKLIVQPMAANA